MIAVSETDPIPIDGEPELTSTERKRLRKIIIDDDRMTWARRQSRWILVTLASVAAGGWAAYEWLRAHIVFKP